MYVFLLYLLYTIAYRMFAFFVFFVVHSLFSSYFKLYIFLFSFFLCAVIWNSKCKPWLLVLLLDCSLLPLYRHHYCFGTWFSLLEFYYTHIDIQTGRSKGTTDRYIYICFIYTKSLDLAWISKAQESIKCEE